jgi:hypothetical protein
MVRVAFNGDFSYTSKLASDFEISEFTLTTFNEPTRVFPNNTIGQTTFTGFTLADDLNADYNKIAIASNIVTYSDPSSTKGMINASAAKTLDGDSANYQIAYYGLPNGSPTFFKARYVKNYNTPTQGVITSIANQPFAGYVLDPRTYPTTEFVTTNTDQAAESVLKPTANLYGTGATYYRYIHNTGGVQETTTVNTAGRRVSRGFATKQILMSYFGYDSTGFNRITAGTLRTTAPGSGNLATCYHNVGGLQVMLVMHGGTLYAFELDNSNLLSSSPLFPNTFIKSIGYEQGTSHMYVQSTPSAGNVRPSSEQTAWDVHAIPLTGYTPGTPVFLGQIKSSLSTNTGMQKIRGTPYWFLVGCTVDVCINASNNTFVPTTSILSIQDRGLVTSNWLLSGCHRNNINDNLTTFCVRNTDNVDYRNWDNSQITIFSAQVQ